MIDTAAGTFAGKPDFNPRLVMDELAGKFFYELKDHLGNVAVVITADRFGVDQDGNGSVDFYVPKVMNIIKNWGIGDE